MDKCYAPMLKWTWGDSEKSEKLKTAYEVEGTIGDHASWDIILSAILDVAIKRNHKNGNYNSWSQHRDL